MESCGLIALARSHGTQFANHIDRENESYSFRLFARYDTLFSIRSNCWLGSCLLRFRRHTSMTNRDKLTDVSNVSTVNVLTGSLYGEFRTDNRYQKPSICSIAVRMSLHRRFFLHNCPSQIPITVQITASYCELNIARIPH